MKISIIIPTFNGGAFLEGAVLSVLSQSAADVELIIIDGGSTDYTPDILEKYRSQATHVVSEKDNGQSDAINKGLKLSSGDIVNWLCCDDRICEGALDIVAREFKEDPGLDLMSGKAKIKNTETGQTSFWVPTEERIRQMPCVNPFPQPSTYLRKRVLLERGYYVKPDHHYSMDFELWNYLVLGRKVRYKISGEVLSEAIITSGNKTSVGGDKAIDELDRIYRQYRKGEWIALSSMYKRTRMKLDSRLANDESLSKAQRILWSLYSTLLNRFYGSGKVHLISNEWRYFYKQFSS